MSEAWRTPKRIPIWFDVPDEPPASRIRIREGMSSLQLGLAIIRSGGWYAAVGCLLHTLYNVASTLMPLALGAAIDRGIAPLTAGTAGRDAIGEFAKWLAVIAGLFLAINATYRFGGRMGWHAVQRAHYELSSRLVERILDPRGFAGSPPLPGRMLAVATHDCHRACSALYFAIYPLGYVVAIVVAATSLFLIHPTLGLTVVIGAPVVLGATTLVAKPLHARRQREQEAIADAAGAAADLIDGFRVLAGIHGQRAATAHYRRVSRTALRGTIAANDAEAALVGVTTALTGLFAATVTVIAAALTFSGAISIGGLIAAAAMAQLLLDPLRILVEQAGGVAAMALASSRRVLDQLHREPNPAALGTAALATVPQLHITAEWSDTTIAVGRDEFVAIDLGATDAASLVAALTLTASTDSAATFTVTLDGRPLADFDPLAVRSTILVPPHDVDLLEPTVIANVIPDGAGPDGEWLARAALHGACAEGLDDELPLGLATPLGDGGRTLSGGQRQRVGLARAIARHAQALVLHNPVSSVDAVTEHDIAVRLRAARRGCTTVVLTSSPAFHAIADRTIDLTRDLTRTAAAPELGGQP